MPWWQVQSMAKEMTPFEAFAREVLGNIPRANGDEWHEIKNELTAHLEDRADALEARGMTSEDAQAQAIARMGDPKEIGQALNAELSVFWGWVGRIAVLAIILVIILSFLPLISVGMNLSYNLTTRFFTDYHDFAPKDAYETVYEEQRDESFQANGVTVAFHGYRVYESQEGYYLETYVSAYANNPFDEVQSTVIQGLYIEEEASIYDGTVSGGGDGYRAAYLYRIAPGQTDFAYGRDQYGVSWETNIAIDWEGIG